MNTPPVIIMGHPRSGSTFFTKVINEHPEIFITDESRIFLSIHRAAQDLRARDLSGPDGWQSTMMKYMRQATLDMYTQWSDQDLSKIVWGDSFPHYGDPSWGVAVPEIESLFPHARFVFLTREKEAVLESLSRLNWPGSPDWYDRIRSYGLSSKIRLGERLLWLEYENGIEANVEVFLKHVGLNSHPKLESKMASEIISPTRYSSPTSW